MRLDNQESRYIDIILCHGIPGSGKSTFLAAVAAVTSPDDCNVIILRIDDFLKPSEHGTIKSIRSAIDNARQRLISDFHATIVSASHQDEPTHQPSILVLIEDNAPRFSHRLAYLKALRGIARDNSISMPMRLALLWCDRALPDAIKCVIERPRQVCFTTTGMAVDEGTIRRQYSSIDGFYGPHRTERSTISMHLIEPLVLSRPSVPTRGSDAELSLRTGLDEVVFRLDVTQACPTSESRIDDDEVVYDRKAIIDAIAFMRSIQSKWLRISPGTLPTSILLSAKIPPIEVCTTPSIAADQTRRAFVKCLLGSCSLHRSELSSVLRSGASTLRIIFVDVLTNGYSDGIDLSERLLLSLDLEAGKGMLAHVTIAEVADILDEIMQPSVLEKTIWKSNTF